MAIKIPVLERIANLYREQTYTYKDLHLDLKKASNYDAVLSRNVDQNDVKVDFDEVAIRNSLNNLFNTRQGQRFLFPLYGLDLTRYIFEAINDTNGTSLGNIIVRTIKKFEPRVSVLKCIVFPFPDDNKYEIELTLQLPTLTTTTNINSILDARTQAFTFL